MRSHCATRFRTLSYRVATGTTPEEKKMRNYPVKLLDFVIPNGVAVSNSLDMRKSRYRGITIFVPATLTNGIILQASVDDTVWFDWQSGGTDIALVASKAVTVDFVGAPYLRVESTGNEGAERTFLVQGVEEF